ncbi:Leucine Rich repeats (2 copies) [Posidoniimonas corsicana]|uniref:Leucine Rich repeats (2 copies) n=1 Tax=Posidoniimonas corsicana TaxID=1938618 RepID=A0A5C5VGN6_9BACT|nr:Leucine Rich repeats (2 copies) [Posidoniimonas corsicana]
MRLASLSWCVVAAALLSASSQVVGSDIEEPAALVQAAIDRNLELGKLHRQSCSLRSYRDGPYQYTAFKRAGDGSKRVVGLCLVVEEDLGCGCCYAPVTARYTEDDIRQVGHLHNLEELYLDYSRFPPTASRHLASLNNLKRLSLEGSDVGDGVLDTISSLGSLEELVLSHTGVTDRGLERLSRLSRLTKLDVSIGQASGRSIETLLRACPLRQAYIYRSSQQEPPAVDAGPAEPVRVCDSDSLETLTLGGQVTTTYVLAGVPALRTLYLMNPGGLQITHAPLLSNVTLRGTLTAAQMEALAGLPNLTSLTLYVGPGSDANALAAVSDLENLSSLGVYALGVDGRYVSALSPPKRLNTLQVSGSDYSPALVEGWLEAAPDLEKLTVRGATGDPGAKVRIAEKYRLKSLAFQFLHAAELELSSLGGLGVVSLDYRCRIDRLVLRDLDALPVGTVRGLVERAGTRPNRDFGEIDIRGLGLFPSGGKAGGR